MKKVLLALAAVGAVSMPALADDHGEKPSDHFPPLNSVYLAGASTMTGLDSNAVAIKAGYSRILDFLYPGVSMDLEASGSVVDSETDFDDLSVEASYFTASGYARYTLEMDGVIKGLSGYGRVGGAYSSIDVVGIAYDSFGLAYGGGLTYGVSERVSLIADFTVYAGEASLREIGVGLKYAF